MSKDIINLPPRPPGDEPPWVQIKVTKIVRLVEYTFEMEHKCGEPHPYPNKDTKPIQTRVIDERIAGSRTIFQETRKKVK